MQEEETKIRSALSYNNLKANAENVYILPKIICAQTQNSLWNAIKLFKIIVFCNKFPNYLHIYIQMFIYYKKNN